MIGTTAETMVGRYRSRNRWHLKRSWDLVVWPPGLGLTWRFRMITTPTTEVAVIDSVFAEVEQYALAAFLAGYRDDP